MVWPSMRVIKKPSPMPSLATSVWMTLGSGTPLGAKARIRSASAGSDSDSAPRGPPGELRRISGIRNRSPTASNDQVCSVAPPDKRRRPSSRSAPGTILATSVHSACANASALRVVGGAV